MVESNEQRLDKKLQQFKQIAEVQSDKKSQGKSGEKEFFDEMTNVMNSLKVLKQADKNDNQPVDMDQVKRILAGRSKPNLYSFQSTLAGEETKKEANVVPFLEGHDLKELKKKVQEQFNLK